jgi:hypothetical protein
MGWSIEDGLIGSDGRKCKAFPGLAAGPHQEFLIPLWLSRLMQVLTHERVAGCPKLLMQLA